MILQHARHSLVSLSFLFAAVTVSLSACQTASGGKGNLHLEPTSATNLVKYMNEYGNGVFAVSEDGHSSQYYFCPAETCRSIGSLSQKAISDCEKRSKGIPCHVLAWRRDIVWHKSNGQTYSYEELIEGHSPNRSADFEAHVGKGYIKLGEQTKRAFAKYMNTYDSGVFAITEDAQHSYTCIRKKCPNQSATDPEIIKVCEAKYGQKCYFFALQQYVVWKKANGQPYKVSHFYDQNNAKPDLDIPLMDAKQICQSALGNDQMSWSAEPTKSAYVEEAERRGMSPKFCQGLF